MAAGINHRISLVPDSAAAPECSVANGGAAAVSIEAMIRESASALLDARKAIRLLETQLRGRVHKHDEDLLGIVADRLTSGLDTLRHLSSRIAAPVQQTMPLCAQPQLTDREQLILRLVVSGCTNKEISGAVHIGVDSIKASLRQIFSKMGVTSRTAAAVEALKHKLVNSDCEACAWQGGKTR